MTRTASQSRLLLLGSVHQRRGHRTVEPDHPAALQLLRSGARQQRPVDPLPGLGPDRADRLVQDRLPRAPRPRQPGKCSKRRRVFQMERQLLIAQLPVLLEQGTAQHRLRRHALPPGFLDPVPAQVGRRPSWTARGGHRATRTSPSTHGRSRVRRRDRIYSARTVRSSRIGGLRWLRVVLWNPWLDAKAYPKPPEDRSPKSGISTTISAWLTFCGRTLASWLRISVAHELPKVGSGLRARSRLLVIRGFCQCDQ